MPTLCSICNNKEALIWWGGKNICKDKECKDKAWKIYEEGRGRRNGENFGTM